MRLCKHRPTGEFYAIKILKKKEILRLKQLEHILNEKAILTEIDHPFIVNLKCTFQDPRYVYLVSFACVCCISSWLFAWS